MKKISFFRRSSHLWKDWWNIRKERFFILIYKKYQSIREFAADLPATHSVFDLVTVKNRTYGMKVISTVKKTRLSFWVILKRHLQIPGHYVPLSAQIQNHWHWKFFRVMYADGQSRYVSGDVKTDWHWLHTR